MAIGFAHRSLGNAGRGFLLLLAAVVSGVRAQAQNSPGTKLTIVTANDGLKHEFTYGWKGISSTAVYGRPPIMYDRGYVRAVCRDECPADLPKDEISEDIAIWTSGKTTTGHVERVDCDDLDRCTIILNGEKYPWSDVNYLRFARPRSR
jgi:hypothetical protein